MKAFSVWYVQMLLLFQVCSFLLLVWRWREVCLSVLGGGTLLIKAKIDWAGSGCFEAKSLPGSLATGMQARCSLLGSFFSCPLLCLPDRVQSLWIEDTWLARANDEQQHELWIWVPPNKREEVPVCQVSHTSEHQAFCCVRGALCQPSPFCLTSRVGRECVLPVLKQHLALYAQVVYFMVSISSLLWADFYIFAHEWLSAGKFQFALIVKDCWVIVASQHSNSTRMFKVLYLQSVIWGENLASPFLHMHTRRQDLYQSISTITVFWYRVSQETKELTGRCCILFVCFFKLCFLAPCCTGLLFLNHGTWDGMVYIPQEGWVEGTDI